MSLPTNPLNRKEAYLNAIATGNTVDMPAKPITREEAYLDAIAKNGGGGGGGTTNYNALDNKPQIAGTTLQGDKSLADLGIASEDAVEDIYAVMGEMGAKNLIPYPYRRDSGYTHNGVTFTINDDNSVTLNGTATGGGYFDFTALRNEDGKTNLGLKAGDTIILNGGHANAKMAVKFLDSNAQDVGSEYTTDANDLKITVPSNMAYVLCYIKTVKNVEYTDVIVYPMIRLASDTDDTYQRYAKTNKQLTDEIANKVDKVEGKGLSTNDYSDTEKGKVADNTSAIAELTEETSGVWDGINGVYTGRDLTVVFASEIADYSDEWVWIQARLDAHDVSGLRVGDYIPIKVGTENHIAEIAGINTYRRTGDGGHEVGYHIDWITRDCYRGTVKFNTTNINNGNANSPSPFLASNLKSWLDGTLYPLLDAKLKNVIKAKRILAPSRYQSGATLTDDNLWGWQDFDKLWVPLETEIFDCLAWSTKGYGNGQAVQYPIFANSYEHRMKGAGPGGARASWWTASANSGNSTNVVSVGSDGGSNYSYASYAFCVPVCFRTMEA